MTQKQRIMNYLESFGSITALDAYRDIGIMTLTNRISDLVRDGQRITRKRETAINRYGEKIHIMRYSLEGQR